MRRAIFGLVFLCAGIFRLQAEDARLELSRDPAMLGMKGVVYRFYDEKSGNPTGRLRVGNVGLEYGSKGFMRVAWKPQMVLTNVELQVSADMAWPEQGSQISDRLRALGGHDVVMMRAVHVLLSGSPDREITAPSARLVSGGIMEFTDATMMENGAAQPAGALRLLLAGPDAGHLMRAVPLSSRTAAQVLSASTNSPRFTP